MAVRTRSRAAEDGEGRASSTADEDLTMHTAVEDLGTDDEEEDQASTSSSSTIRALLAKARAKYDYQGTGEEEAELIQLDEGSEDEVVLAQPLGRPPTKAQKRARLPIVPPTTDPTTNASKKRPRDRFGLPPPRPPLPPSQLRLLRSLPAHRLPPSILSHPQSASHLRRPLPFHELPLSDARDPSVKREIQALRLHNSLDPKRFYRGGGGGKDRDKVPERMAFGYVVESGMGARVGEKGPQQRAVRKRSFLEALVADETAKAYAKKKYVGEVQKRAGSGGKLFYRRLQQKRQQGRR